MSLGSQIQLSSLQKLRVLWEFSRPHTIIGTTCSVWSLYALATLPNQSFGTHWAIAVGAWLTCLLGNVYIVGLNQILDVPIDRINKPQLPLAANELTPTQAWWIVGLTGFFAILSSAMQGQFLLAVVVLSLIIGTAYSSPPMRLKRFPFWAVFCILGVRGVIVNLGLFLHYQNLFGDSLSISNIVWALTGFVVVFTIAIALCKDIPDLEGDRHFQISTFTVKLGTTTVFRFTVSVLVLSYVGLMIFGLVVPLGVNLNLFLLVHFCLLFVLGFQVRIVDLSNQASITRFYQFIWKLFFLEYLLLPLLYGL